MKLNMSKMLLNRDFKTHPYLGMADPSPFSTAQVFKHIEDRRKAAKIQDWTVAQSTVGQGDYQSYILDRDFVRSNHSFIFPNGAVGFLFGHSPVEVATRRKACDKWEAYQSLVEQQVEQHILLFQDPVSDSVKEDILAITSITYEPDDQSANSMLKIREVKNSFINYLPQPNLCHQTVLQLLNDLPIVNTTDEFEKMLTQVDLIMAAAKLSLYQMDRPFLRNPSYPLPTTDLLVVSVLQSVSILPELSVIRQELENWKSELNSVIPLLGRVYGVEWSQGRSVILQKLANLTAVKKMASPSAFLSMGQQFYGSSDPNHYYNCRGELYSMTSVISDESRGRSMTQQGSPSKSLTDRSRSRYASPGNTGRSQSPGYRGQQVYGGQNT